MLLLSLLFIGRLEKKLTDGFPEFLQASLLDRYS